MAPHLEVLPSGMDIVVRALPAAADASGTELARDLSSGLRRVMSRLGHQAVTGVAVSQ
jgi:RNase P protein component